MPKGYHHLTSHQRCQFESLKERGDSINFIAGVLRVHRSTLYRELRRNRSQIRYESREADSKSIIRRQMANRQKTKMKQGLCEIIEEKLKQQWSPEQISGWLKKQGHKQIPVSHETIYQYVWKDKKHGGILYKNLRHNGKNYVKRSTSIGGRGCIPHRRDIDERPSIVERKERLGDWELDTIIGKGHKGALVSMVERRTRLTKIAFVKHKTADQVTEAIFHTLYSLKAFVHTLTSDNGKEFSFHEDLSLELKADFFFAKPYHAWERGLNEHTNGLIRQYFPKNMKFNQISLEALERVEYLLNNRPRKVLNFATPLEVFDQLANQALVVALGT